MSLLKRQLADILTRNWWVLLLRGLAAIAFGVMTWLMPSASLAVLVLLFAAFALVDGIFGVWLAIAGRKEHEDWWTMLLWGLVGIGAGVLTLLAPSITALALLFYIAIWAIATGVLQIAMAIRLRKEISGEWLLALAGLASVVFGVLLILQPGVGALAVLWLIASYAVIFGVLLVLLAFRARGFGRRLTNAQGAAAER